MDLEQPEVPVEQKTPRVKFSFLRLVRRTVVFLFSFILIITGAAFFIGYFYQDAVKEYFIAELNKKLNSQVIVDAKDIDFTVIKDFPFASVSFANVKALDAIAGAGKDTLFTAGEISLQFNIVDLFHQNYHIRRIRLEDARLRLRVDKDGADNFHFWKSSADSAATRFSFALERIELKNVVISYQNRRDRQSLEMTVHNSRLAGAFSSEKYSMSIASDLFIDKLKVDSTVYLRRKAVKAEVTVGVDNVIRAYKFSKGRIAVEGLSIELSGSIMRSNDESLLNLGISGRDMNIGSVLSLVPAPYRKNIDDYDSDGEFYFSATVAGSMAKGRMPAIHADFGMKDAVITQLKDHVSLEHVNLEGHFTSEKGSKLSLNKISGTFSQGRISGDLEVSDFSDPSFSGHLQANVSLAEVQKFIHADTLENVAGDLMLNTIFSGKAAKGRAAMDDIIATGDMKLEGTSLKIKNNPLDFHEISGRFHFDNNDLVIDAFRGKISSSDFDLHGSFRNVVAWMLHDHQYVTIDAVLHSSLIDLDELLANKDENTVSRQKYSLKLSDNLDILMQTTIDRLKFRKFEASDIKGLVTMKDRKLIADALSLNTMGGTITTSGMIDGGDTTRLLISCFSDISKINISRMFTEFENFGQTTITDRNIKGLASAKVQFAAVLSPSFVMDLDKLYAAIDMTLDNGELNNVESFRSLSRFIELKELENIRFATLKNQLEVRKRVITIPKMEIHSTALNITASGTHDFDNIVNYKFRISLNELLAKKARAAKKENEEFGEVEDDGLGRTNIFISMTGPIDNPVIRYDSKSAVQNVKQDLKVEKQNLKSILKDEFGLFKKDTTLSKSSEVRKEDQAKFRINWEDAEPSKDQKKELKKPKKPEDDDF